MIKAAGILFLAGGAKVLLLRRGVHGDHPGLWAFSGGKIEPGETPEQAARRKTEEETGFRYAGPLVEWTRRRKDGVDYTTFLAHLDEAFTPRLNFKHVEYVWADAKELSEREAARSRADEARRRREGVMRGTG